ncbi:MAG: hypothetical protein LBK62_13995, partial [Treponema sp.]|nr:hypothetical protein [Treponema sp.]
MAHNKDFVPGADAQFGIWLENLTGYVDAMLAAGTWTHIPPDKGTVLKQRRADWRTAYGRTRGPHTSVDT